MGCAVPSPGSARSCADVASYPKVKRQKVKGKRQKHFHLLPFAFCLIVGLALLPLGVAAQLLGWGLAIALALIDPAFGLYWAVLSVPAQELVSLPGGLSYTQAAMLVAVGAWGLRTLAHPERRI